MLNDKELSAYLYKLGERGLLRSLAEYGACAGKFMLRGRSVLNFSSNDYLNLSSSAESKLCVREAVAEWGVGAGASRLVCGTSALHTELERELAEIKGYPAALVFGSGALANIGALQALLGRQDVVFADKLVHATMLDGIRLSGAKLLRFKHNDLEHLEQLLRRESRKRAVNSSFLIATESLFSMDGDTAPLVDLCALAERFSAELYVDEAHSFGVFGARGSGLVDALGLNDRIRFVIGTLSKALGSYGGFVCSSAVCREYLINRSRSFIYSTALPPASVAGALAGLAFIKNHPEAGAELLRRSTVFRAELQRQNVNIGGSGSQIIPVVIGDDRRATEVGVRLRAQGIIAAVIREPTVPKGTARLRLSVTLAHEDEDLTAAAQAIGAVLTQE